MARQPIPKLLDTLRGLSVEDIARAVGASRGAVEGWRRGATPSERSRAKLIKVAQRQAATLLDLLAEVTREEAASDERSGQ